ncbi:MAG TPA: dipicolinate synthase subunit DpsA [Limnochordia bacterium]|nr:dipicolinate synthase subunit DpsA [Limnochordia bacterium]
MAGQLVGTPVSMLGCDGREVELAAALLERGVDLRLVGFPKEERLQKALHFQEATAAVQGTKAVIAPMSSTDAAGRVTAHMLPPDLVIDLTEVIPRLSSGTPLLIGVARPVIRGLAAQYSLRLVELAEIEEIAILNAIPTAEGAIQVAMENTAITIHNSRCLVLGFGRCGTALARSLKGLGARVTVCARSAQDLAGAFSLGCETLPLAALQMRRDFDIIFNTIPAMVLPRSYLRQLERETVIVDIASGPGGTDFAAAQQLGLKAVHALSLPGRVAPKTAAAILVKTVPRLLENLLGEDDHGSDS